jgi:hypothetical protein
MRLKGRYSGLVLVSAALLVGCGSDVTVQVFNEAPQDGEATAAADLPVVFLPFDRDSVFEVMTAAASAPEPEVPQDLIDTFRQIAALQEEWRLKDGEWAEARDRLQTLSAELQSMDRRSRDYMQRYEEFNNLDSRVSQLDREKQAAFDAFDSLQRSAVARADSIRIAIQAWEEEAFAGYDDAVTEILQSTGKEIYEDTTNADGVVRRSLSGGDWWVHTRIQIPRGEFYWNLRIDPSAGDTIRLDTSNAEDRVRL